MDTRLQKNPFAPSERPDERARAVQMLLIATAVAVVLNFVPYAQMLTYPLRLMVTFLHEGSHALISLLTGGLVRSIAIQPDGSGVTMTSPGSWIGAVLTSSAGYLGSMFYGALLIGLLRRGVEARRLLLLTGVLIGLVTLGVVGGLFFSWNAFGLFWGVLLTLGLIAGGLRLSPAVAGWAAAFIGVQCVMNAFYDLRVLFDLTVAGSRANDAMNLQRLTWIPAPVWAALWMLMAVGMLIFVLRPNRRPTGIGAFR